MSIFKTKSKIENVEEKLKKAVLIFEYTHDSASSLFETFDQVKKERGNLRGILPEKEQDILRAALVMTCAGIDGALKQGIRDCLPQLLEDDTSVRDGFEKFIRKRISNDDNSFENGSGIKFLSQILSDKKGPRDCLIEEYIRHLTGSSLQSYEEVLRTVAALGIDQKVLQSHILKLKNIFVIRNRIIHELDIDFGARRRNRRTQNKKQILEHSDCILEIMKTILEELNRKLSKTT